MQGHGLWRVLLPPVTSVSAPVGLSAVSEGSYLVCVFHSSVSQHKCELSCYHYWHSLGEYSFLGVIAAQYVLICVLCEL